MRIEPKQIGIISPYNKQVRHCTAKHPGSEITELGV
jgi:hypothetical protein